MNECKQTKSVRNQSRFYNQSRAKNMLKRMNRPKNLVLYDLWVLLMIFLVVKSCNLSGLLFKVQHFSIELKI